MKRWLFIIAFAGLALRIAAWQYFRVHTLALVSDRLPDDALYYFAMARNLAHGSGISFDGIHPSNGMHPLWLFLITPIFFLGITKWGAIQAILLLQSILDAGIVWLIGNSIYRLLPMAKASNRVTAAAMCSAIYALSSVVLLRSINGLETTLAALLFVLWFRALQWTVGEHSGKQAEHRWRWMAIGIVTGLLLLARTDSFIVLLPIGLYLGVRVRTIWKGLLTAVVFTLIFLAPWLLWNAMTFGTIMQSSAEAVPMLAMRKYHAIYGSMTPIYLVLDALRNGVKPLWMAGCGIPAIAIVYAIMSRRKNLTFVETSIYLLMLGGILLLMVHSLFRGFIRDWYVMELVPLFLIGFGIAIGANANATDARPSGRWTLAIAIILVQLLLYHSSQYISQASVVQEGLPEVTALTQHAKVASFNSGYYGYFSNRAANVVNIDGVVNADALRALKAGNLRGYLASDTVQYILDFRGDFGGYLNLFDRRMLADFTQDTTFGNPIGGNDALILYRRK